MGKGRGEERYVDGNGFRRGKYCCMLSARNVKTSREICNLHIYMLWFRDRNEFLFFNVMRSSLVDVQM
jgi:hypothetical protein